MQNWSLIEPIIEDILTSLPYTKSEGYQGNYCFLTAYQIAVLVNKRDRTLRGHMPVGGVNEGRTTFAQQIAKQLSAEIKNNTQLGSRLEIQFLSIVGLDEFTFNGTNTQPTNSNSPSLNQFSMFRYIPQTKPISKD